MHTPCAFRAESDSIADSHKPAKPRPHAFADDGADRTADGISNGRADVAPLQVADGRADDEAADVRRAFFRAVAHADAPAER